MRTLDADVPRVRCKDFLSILDFNHDELLGTLELASRLKRERPMGLRAPTAHALDGRHIGMLFEKPSLRTRVTFTIGVRELGGDMVEIPADVMHADREPIHDVARNLERWVDALDPDIAWYYDRGDEYDRLSTSARLERLRTEELLERFLPAAPARVLDVGGGPGEYAAWLGARGYDVTLVDPVPLHVEQAVDRGVAAVVGDARTLEFETERFDAVLLLGPLYHLPARDDRIQFRIRHAQRPWRLQRGETRILDHRNRARLDRLRQPDELL